MVTKKNICWVVHTLLLKVSTMKKWLWSNKDFDFDDGRRLGSEVLVFTTPHSHCTNLAFSFAWHLIIMSVQNQVASSYLPCLFPFLPFYFFYFFIYKIEILLYLNLSVYIYKVSSWKLEPQPLPPPTSIYTCGVTIIPKVCRGPFPPLVLLNLYTLKKNRDVGL